MKSNMESLLRRGTRLAVSIREKDAKKANRIRLALITAWCRISGLEFSTSSRPGARGGLPYAGEPDDTARRCGILGVVIMPSHAHAS
jgi:hypothetical protein